MGVILTTTMSRVLIRSLVLFVFKDKNEPNNFCV